MRIVQRVWVRFANFAPPSFSETAQQNPSRIVAPPYLQSQERRAQRMTTSRSASPSRSDPRYDLEAYEYARLEAESEPSRGSSSGIFGRSGWNDVEIDTLQSLRRMRLASPPEEKSVSSRSSVAPSVHGPSMFQDVHSYSSSGESRRGGRAAPPATGTESLANWVGRLDSQSVPGTSRAGAAALPHGFDSAPPERRSQGERSHQRSYRSGAAVESNISGGTSTSRDSRLRSTREYGATSSGQPLRVEDLMSLVSGAAQPNIPHGSSASRDSRLPTTQEHDSTSRQQSSTWENLKSLVSGMSRRAGSLSSGRRHSGESPSLQVGGDIPASQRSANKRRPMKVPALMPGDMVPSQGGETCKPTALAALDAYFAQKYGVGSIPLRKRMAGGSNSGPGERPISVRQIAKANGSRQGEILQADMFQRVAQEMGYEATVHRPADIKEFRETVMDSIADRKPLVAFFPVHRETDLPTRNFDGGNEHAALIVGYDRERDTVDLAHYESLYEAVPMKKLYRSMQKLPSTREQEIYQHTGNSVSGRTRKYSLVRSADDSDSQFLYSIVPEQGSGFKNTLFVMSPDPAHDRWSGSRSRG